MLDKHRVIAITKCDLLDEEMIADIAKQITIGLPTVFISAVAQSGLDELKDILWKELNSESNKLEAVQTEQLVHRKREVRQSDEPEDEIVEDFDIDEAEEEL